MKKESSTIYNAPISSSSERTLSLEGRGIKGLSLLLSFLFSLSVVFSSCSGSETAKQSAPSVSTDSTVLRIAVFPALDALPLALANDWGVFDSLGVKAELVVFRSQMDAEKALADGKADAVLTDMFRVGWWQWQHRPVRFAFSTDRQLFVVPNKVLRISRIDQLDDRMIACSRHSQEDYFADRVIAQIKLRKGQILRPQINSVELRLSMLQAGQLDAAVLGTQQALKARATDCPSLQESQAQKAIHGFAGIAFSTLSIKKKGRQLSQLRKAYNIVVGRLHSMAAMPQIDEQTRSSLFLNEGIDTLLDVKTDFTLATRPTENLRLTVAEWLNSRGATKGYSADTLFTVNQ